MYSIVLLIVGLIFDGVGAFFIVKPILFYYNNFKKREIFLNAFEEADFSFLRRATEQKMNPVDILHQRINHFFQLQREHSKNQRIDEKSNASTAQTGVYLILLGLVCIGISNIM